MHGRSILSSRFWQIDRTVCRSRRETETAQRKRTPVRAFESLTHRAPFDGDDPHRLVAFATLWHGFACLHGKRQRRCRFRGPSPSVGLSPRRSDTPTSPHNGRAELTQLPSFVRFAGTTLRRATSTIAFDRPDGSSRQEPNRAKLRWTESKAESRNDVFRTLPPFTHK